MMIEEFEVRTGFYPDADLYRMIEAYYYDFEGTKDDFCAAYKTNADGLAEKIRFSANREKQAANDAAEKNIKALRKEIEMLERALDVEKEWKPIELEGNVRQAEYKKLKASGEPWEEKELKQWIADDFGFNPEKIKICNSVPTYEIDRHNRIRRTGEVDRSPAYVATDWNYARFNCGTVAYELHNGELRFFSE